MARIKGVAEVGEVYWSLHTTTEATVIEANDTFAILETANGYKRFVMRKELENEWRRKERRS